MLAKLDKEQKTECVITLQHCWHQIHKNTIYQSLELFNPLFLPNKILTFAVFLVYFSRVNSKEKIGEGCHLCENFNR